jgi:hypothetical protein
MECNISENFGMLRWIYEYWYVCWMLVWIFWEILIWMTLDLLGLNRGMNVDILGNIGIKILTDVTYATR